MKTEYSLGDIVWGIYQGSEKQPSCPTCGYHKFAYTKWKIREYSEEIMAISIRREFIMYETEDPYNMYEENEIFLTKDAAQAECDRRNLNEDNLEI